MSNSLAAVDQSPPIPPLVIREVTLGDHVDSAAKKWGDATGWVFGDERVSFRQMRGRAEVVARALLAHGIRKGDVVALWMSNLPEFAYCVFACGKIGAIATAINTRSRSFEVGHTLRHSGAKVLIRMDRFLKMDFRAIFGEVAGHGSLADDGTVVAAGLPDLRLAVVVSPNPEPGALPWRKFLERATEVEPGTVAAAQGTLRWDEPVIVQYTSGTTDRPKGALCNHRYICNFGVDTVRRLGVVAGEPVLNTQPFYHNGGLCGALCTPLSVGHCAVAPEYYEPERVLQLIERERCVARSGFGAMYVMEMDHPKFRNYDLSSLRAAWCLADEDVMRRVAREMRIPVLVQLYGATEGGGTAGSIADPVETRSTNCGRAVSGTEVAIQDPGSGEMLPPDTPGEIVVRGWWQMNGYLHQTEATAAVFDDDGWLHTGDLGRLDAVGYLTFLGRIKNMLKVGGENVSAEEVEMMLRRHPKVRTAAVLAAPDPRLKEVVMAVVELRDKETATEAEIVEFCAVRMANFRVPRIVRFIKRMPISGSGKIDRAALRARFLEPKNEVAEQRA